MLIAKTSIDLTSRERKNNKKIHIKSEFFKEKHIHLESKCKHGR